MVSRIAIVCLLSILGGCSGASMEAPTADADSGGATLQTLQFQGDSSVNLLPNKTVDLSVQFHDLLGGTVAGVGVDFSLTSSASGASLMPAHATTDVNGVATTTLRVGSSTGDLQVRAKTDTGVTAYVEVSVGEALGAELAVTVDYTGQRELASYTVTSLEGMSCSAALQSGLAGSVSYTIPVTSRDPVSFMLGSGISTAIVGFGRDSSGAKLAQGCQEYTAPITADPSEAQQALALALSSQPLSFDDALPMVLQIDLLSAGKRLAQISENAVNAVFASAADATTAEADYYLDAVASALTAAGSTDAAAALADRRTSAAFASSLASALSDAKVGPKVFAAQLAAALQDRGADATLNTTYQAGQLGAVSAAGALSTDGTQQLTLALAPQVSIVSSFSSDSAQLLVTSLSVQLSLGDYAVAVLAALNAETSSAQAPAATGTALDTATGCSAVFGDWWSKQGLASVCDEATAIAACSGAKGSLIERIDTSLRVLNDVASVIQLSGTVQAVDRNDDGEIDDLGPTNLSGAWGSDTVVADVSVPIKSAFAH